LLGKQVQLVEKDDATNPNNCLSQVKNLAGSGIKIFTGGMSSDAAIATGQYLADNNILMVSPSATASSISEYPWTNWLFRTVPSDAFQSKILAKLIIDKGFTRLATIVPSNSYGQGLESSLMDELVKSGWKGKIILMLHFDPEKKDYGEELAQLDSENPDVIFAVSYVEDGIRLFSQALSIGLDRIPWLACDGNYGDVMFANKECAEFMEKAVIAGTRFAGPLAGTAYDHFAAGYKADFGKDPSVYCDTSYDAVKMLAAAIEKAGVYDGTAVRDALLELGKGYEGASGKITFDEKGDRTTGIFEIWKVIQAATASGYRNVRTDIVRID